MADDWKDKFPEAKNNFQKAVTQDAIQRKIEQKKQQQKDQEKPGPASKMELERLENDRIEPQQTQTLRPPGGQMPDADFQQAQIRREHRIQYIKRRLQAQKDMARDQFNENK